MPRPSASCPPAINATNLATAKPSDPVGRRLMKLNHFLITDIDNTLIGNDNASWKTGGTCNRNRDRIGFGVATGRTADSARSDFKKVPDPHPDVIICSVGSALFYGRRKKPSPGWASHISNPMEPG
jgi:sucrose-phosphate synthase